MPRKPIKKGNEYIGMIVRDNNYLQSNYCLSGANNSYELNWQCFVLVMSDLDKLKLSDLSATTTVWTLQQ